MVRQDIQGAFETMAWPLGEAGLPIYAASGGLHAYHREYLEALAAVAPIVGVALARFMPKRVSGAAASRRSEHRRKSSGSAASRFDVHLAREAEFRAAGNSMRGGSGRSNIVANKIAGDKSRDMIAAREAPARTEEYFRTPHGPRKADVFKLGDQRIIIESKVGRTSLIDRVRGEIEKDRWHLQHGKVDGVIWEFTLSPMTNQGGATRPLLDELRKAGCEVRINQ